MPTGLVEPLPNKGRRIKNLEWNRMLSCASLQIDEHSQPAPLHRLNVREIEQNDARVSLLGDSIA